MAWSASDNIEMDSIRILYSNNGGSEFVLMDRVHIPTQRPTLQYHRV